MIKPLPLKLFLKTFDYAPRLAISLVVLNARGEVLLARRAIAPGVGSWHLPGGFILKGESFQQCIQRLVRKELGLKMSAKLAKQTGAFENLHKDPRGHVVDLIYILKVSAAPRPTKETQEIKFFKKLPAVIGFGHGDILRELGYK